MHDSWQRDLQVQNRALREAARRRALRRALAYSERKRREQARQQALIELRRLDREADDAGR